MKFNNRKFIKAIVDYRYDLIYKKQQNIGLRAFSKIMGVSASTLSRIHNGRKSDIDSILSICTVLKKPIQNFITK